MNGVKAFCRYVDTFSEWTGRCVGWLVLVLTFVIGYDVALRYLFNAPTKWAYEMSYQIGGVFFWLGAAYALKHGSHVRIDIFYSYFSRRTKALLDAALYLLLFFPVWIGLTYYLYPYVMHLLAYSGTGDDGLLAADYLSVQNHDDNGIDIPPAPGNRRVFTQHFDPAGRG